MKPTTNIEYKITKEVLNSIWYKNSHYKLPVGLYNLPDEGYVHVCLHECAGKNYTFINYGCGFEYVPGADLYLKVRMASNANSKM